MYYGPTVSTFQSIQSLLLSVVDCSGNHGYVHFHNSKQLRTQNKANQFIFNVKSENILGVGIKVILIYYF